MAAKKFGGAQRGTAFALQAQEQQRAVAASDRRPVVEHGAGVAWPATGRASISLMRSPSCMNQVGRRGLSARTSRSSLGRGFAPVDRAFLAPQLLRIGHAGLGLDGERWRGIGVERLEQQGARRAGSVHRAIPPQWRAGLSARFCMSRVGPVSSPATIRMIVTPVSISPARMARSIGAAPRQRGNSEAWTLKQPSRGAAEQPLAAGSARRRRRPRRRA